MPKITPSRKSPPALAPNNPSVTRSVGQVPSALPRAVQIPEHLRVAALSRIVSQVGDVELAARRLLAAAPGQGIDLSLLFGVVDEPLRGRGRPAVRQACLCVLGAGRTAMMFISEPPVGGDAEGFDRATLGRAACLDAACQHLRSAFGQRVVLAQALQDPSDTWALDTFARAGFLSVGTLEYMRMVFPPREVIQPNASPNAGMERSETTRVALPGRDGLVALRCDALPDQTLRERLLIDALNASYVDTLDCPELCGLRDTVDILESHRATGQCDLSLWWLLMAGAQPVGCVLLNPAAAPQRSVELVYLGLAPAVRGKGVGKAALSLAIGELNHRRRLGTLRADEFACAVDARNSPAVGLYRSFGFSSFCRREALVKRL